MKRMDKRKLNIRMKRDQPAQNLLKDLQRRAVRMERLVITQEAISFVMTKNQLPLLRAARKKNRAKIRIHYGEADKIIQFDGRTVIGLFLLVCIPIIMMQFVWKIEIQADTIEMTDTMSAYIEQELGMQAPLLKTKLQSDYELRQNLMQQFREFSWVHIAKQGSHMTITPQLAPKSMLQETSQLPTYLIASNSGIITHFEIEQGERQVKPHMTVYKGDLLVSGVIGEGEEKVVVGAKGEVYADYWLEAMFSVPRIVQYDRLVDQQLRMTWNPGALEQAANSRTLKPLLSLVEWEKVQKFERIEEQLEEEHVETRLLPLLHEKIVRTLPQKSTVKSENLLHVTFDDDTVKGKVLFFINENIATPYRSGQGD